MVRGRARISGTRGGWGFTLIELMVVVAIVALMLVVAVPSFKQVIQTNRVSSEVNTFVGDLQYARSEAIRRGATVSVCSSSDGSTCLSDNQWNKGWIVFFDANADGAVSGTGDVVMRQQKAWAGTDTMVVSSTPALSAVSFNRDGFMSNAALTFSVRTTPADSRATKCIALSLVGRQTIQKAGVGSCS